LKLIEIRQINPNLLITKREFKKLVEKYLADVSSYFCVPETVLMEKYRKRDLHNKTF